MNDPFADQEPSSSRNLPAPKWPNVHSDDDPSVVYARRAENQGPRPEPRAESEGGGIPPATWTFVDAFVRRRGWFVLAGLIFAALGVAAGLAVWKTNYTAVAQLLRYDSPQADEILPPRPMTPQMLANLLRAPELQNRVGSLAKPPLTADDMARSVRIVADRNTDAIMVIATRSTADEALNLANLYARESVLFTQQLQAKTADELNRYLKMQLGQVEHDIPALYQQLRTVSRTTLSVTNRAAATSVSRPIPSMDRLFAAREELFNLLGRYTEAHPFVQAQRSRIAAIEKELLPTLGNTNAPATTAETGNNAAANTAETPRPVLDIASMDTGKVTDHDIVRSQLQSLESGRLLLSNRQRGVQTFVDKPAGYCRLFAEATPQELVVNGRNFKVALLTLLAGVGGLGLVAFTVTSRELMDNRLRTVADVQRVTRLPVLATANDLSKMKPEERADWAFRTWTALQHRLSPSPNCGLVCGITSSGSGEGRSTWLNLLAEAANRRGFRVLTIATKPSTGDGASPEQEDQRKKAAASAAKTGANGAAKNGTTAQTAATATAPATTAPKAQPGSSLTPDFLASPSTVTDQLTRSDTDALVHIPLPGWVWNLERRKQWQTALRDWRQVDNLVILVELPPACVAESVLLAENLPNVVWLADATQTSAAEARQQLQTMRHARCNLVGAFLNRESESPVNRWFPRWMSPLNQQMA